MNLGLMHIFLESGTDPFSHLRAKAPDRNPKISPNLILNYFYKVPLKFLYLNVYLNNYVKKLSKHMQMVGARTKLYFQWPEPLFGQF